MRDLETCKGLEIVRAVGTRDDLIRELTRERDEARRERERLREETLTWRTQFEAVCETRNAFQIEIRRLKDEAERLREGKDLLAKQLAYYRRDNEKLNNALAWEHNESENAMDAKRYRWLKRQASTDDYDTRVNVIDDILAQYGERWDALIDAAMDGK